VKEEHNFCRQELYTQIKTLNAFVAVHISVKTWGKWVFYTLGTAFSRKWYWIASAEKVSNVECYGIYWDE